jgi:hypothetical protein
MPAELNETNSLGRARLTNTKRIEMLERDRAQQSRVLTELVNASKSFTPEQIAQLRTVIREEWADAGLRLDGAVHQDEAREDFRFLRGLRRMRDNMSTKIGNAVITAVIVICFAIIGSGFWQWINSGGK